MNKKILTIFIMLIMVFSVVSTLAIEETYHDEEYIYDDIPVLIKYPMCACEITDLTWDCDLWSDDDHMVNLGVPAWSLLNGTAMVSAFKNFLCGSCLCSQKYYYCGCDFCCCCICDENNNICAFEEINCSHLIEHGLLTHRGTNGLGVGNNFDDCMDTIDGRDYIIISFDRPQRLVSFEIRSLFIEKHDDTDFVEEGFADLLLGRTLVQRYRFTATELEGSGDGRVIVSEDISDNKVLFFDQIVFHANTSECLISSSDFAVAKLQTKENTISFVQPLEGVDCDYLLADLPPVVSDIPNQKINLGDSFATISLDDYVSDPDNNIADLTWSFSGNNILDIHIYTSDIGNPPTNVRFAQISAPNGWIGTETITFTATDPDALYDSSSATFTVLEKDPENIVPVAVINISSYGYVYDEIVLNGSGSYDLDGSIVEYRWSYIYADFLPVFIGNGESITHAFEHPGIFNVELLITDNNDSKDVNYSTIEILIPCDPDDDYDGDEVFNSDEDVNDDDDRKLPVVEPPNSIPTKPIVEGPSEGLVNEVLEFIISADDQDNDSLRYIIQWGDGEVFISDFMPSGVRLTVNHSYNFSGEFVITVKSEDIKALSEETIVNIKINDKEKTINDKIIDTGKNDNVFWVVIGILGLILFITPIGLIFKRKLYKQD